MNKKQNFQHQIPISAAQEIKLRDYQQALIRLVYKKWDSGKTVILSEISENLPTEGEVA